MKTTVEKRSIQSAAGSMVVAAGLGATFAKLVGSEAIHGGMLGAGIAVCYVLFKSKTVLKPFVEPKDDDYLGSKDTASLIYDGKKDYQELTLEPKWRTMEFADLSRY